MGRSSGSGKEPQWKEKKWTKSDNIMVQRNVCMQTRTEGSTDRVRKCHTRKEQAGCTHKSQAQEVTSY